MGISTVVSDAWNTDALTLLHSKILIMLNHMELEVIRGRDSSEFNHQQIFL